MANVPILSFNKGEFSPKIEVRTDTEMYRSGCKKLENFIPLIQGPVERRPGTKFLYDSEAVIGGPGMSFSDYTEAKLLDHLFGKGDYTVPTIYIAASLTAPGDSGTDMTEPSGGSYARITTSAANWADAAVSDGETIITNAAELSFAESTGTWGTVTHYVLMDALTSGNVLASGKLTNSLYIESGDILTFAIGAIVVSLD